MIRTDSRHSLGYLTGCYFHEDWTVEASSWHGIIAQFVDENPLVQAIGAAGELGLVISAGVADIDDYMYEAFAMYTRPRVGEDGTSWLRDIRAEIGNCVVADSRFPSTYLDSLLERLRALRVIAADDADGGGDADDADFVGEAGGTDEPDEAERAGLLQAARYGESAPHDEIAAVLGILAVALAPDAETDPWTRACLDQVDRAIAAPAARRWPLTAQAM